MVDSTGSIFNFKQLEDGRWVADEKIGQDNFETIKERIKPMLAMPEHKDKIDDTKTISEIVELIHS